MSNWKIKQLQELADCLDGKRIPIKQSERNKRKGKYPYYGASGIIDWVDDFIFDEELLLLAEDGANLISRSSPIAFIAKNKYWVNNHAHVYKPKQDIDINYICEYIKSIDLTPYITGSAQPKLNQEICNQIPIVFPPLSEQKRISSILIASDATIQSNNTLLRKILDLKNALMQTFLTKGIGNSEFKDSSIGFIPKGWQLQQISDIAEVIRGASPRPQGDPKYYGGKIPRLMVADITRDGKYVTPRIDSLTEEGAKRSRFLQKGTLVLVCSGTVGIPSILAIDSCIHDGFLALLNIKDSCELDYLYYYFYFKKNEFDTAATHGGVFTNLTTDIVKNFFIPLPPKSEQMEIIKILCTVDNHINSIKRKITQLTLLKQALIQELIFDKVRIRLLEPELTGMNR